MSFMNAMRMHFSNNNSKETTVKVQPKEKKISDRPVSAPIPVARASDAISYESIHSAIIRIRSNSLIGKGKLSKEEYLSDHLYAMIKHYEPETNITYDMIETAIAFVKTSPLMGSGKWTKDEHLAEYIFATIRQTNKKPNPLPNTGPENVVLLSEASIVSNGSPNTLFGS